MASLALLNIDKAFGKTTALRNVSLTSEAGLTAIVGESGSGKSTLGRIALGLLGCDRGQVLWDGVDITTLDRNALCVKRAHFAMVFQDPSTTLNPKLTVYHSLRESLFVHKLASSDGTARARVHQALEEVSLAAAATLDKLPSELSGGQRQRVAIARALITDPQFVVFDEPVSALDAIVGAQIENLIAELARARNMTGFYISHDLDSVRRVASQCVVMKHGEIIERASIEALWNSPQHEYTQALLRANS